MSERLVQGYNFSTLKVLHVADHVLEVRLDRPKKMNSLNMQMWTDMRECFAQVADEAAVRAVLLTGSGKHFCAGLDLATAASGLGGKNGIADVAHRAVRIRRLGKAWQDSFSNIERCGKVVIACIHGVSIGAAVEMISAADLRLCTTDVKFRIAEIDVGLAADVGGLQRFPKIVGNQSLVRELVFSAREFGGAEAMSMGFVSSVSPNKDAMMARAVDLAKQIASKSPVALFGAKTLLNYSRDHSVDESLEYAITWNQSMVQTLDSPKAAVALLRKKPATFPNLPASKL
eukprot:TRINITY_DN4099_c0_g1_i1.p1 TRINITY_DN4099_c0_g1~~TRINITY_DN4099_c0_g1_i1.p1  ORF type:complete len:288 (+),score=99.10 TRINITY_DN4099_c0_g1_i1:73-936(+)